MVSGVDDVPRRDLIGGATSAPVHLVSFGVLGGLAAFRLIGLYLGPTVPAALLAAWRDRGAVPVIPNLRPGKAN